jgi:hypothetical protein
VGLLFAQAFDRPGHAFVGAFAFGVDLEGFFEIGNTGARAGQGGQHQPGFFEFWGQLGGLDGVTARKSFVMRAQGFLGFFNGPEGGNMVGIHGVVGLMLSLLM